MLNNVLNVLLFYAQQVSTTSPVFYHHKSGSGTYQIIVAKIPDSKVQAA